MMKRKITSIIVSPCLPIILRVRPRFAMENLFYSSWWRRKTRNTEIQKYIVSKNKRSPICLYGSTCSLYTEPQSEHIVPLINTQLTIEPTYMQETHNKKYVQQKSGKNKNKDILSKIKMEWNKKSPTRSPGKLKIMKDKDKFTINSMLAIFLLLLVWTIEPPACYFPEELSSIKTVNISGSVIKLRCFSWSSPGNTQ